jgi:MoaA/NifB/PqqE/SkfB family radical SAM enzyme
MAYEQVYFELSGVCNGHCPWCPTGNRSPFHSMGTFISPDLFRKAITRLRDLEFIDARSIFYFFNWGELFLHPRYEELLSIAAQENLLFIISTNGSQLEPLAPPIFKNLLQVIVSFPGFSQQSYDKIHGFNFEKIKGRLIAFMEHAQKNGVPHRVHMAYHIYQFNITEIPAAMLFCKQYGIKFAPVLANFGDFDIAIRYFENTLDTQTLKRAAKDLLLYNIDDCIAKRPEGYVCPQFNLLTLDEECNVLTCCGVPRKYKDYALGSLFELSREQIIAMKKDRSVCKKCGEIGLDYFGNHPITPNYIDIFTTYTNIGGRIEELQAHYGALMENHLDRFMNTLCETMESAGMDAGKKYYNQFRWCFPNVPELKKVDDLMTNS